MKPADASQPNEAVQGTTVFKVVAASMDGVSEDAQLILVLSTGRQVNQPPRRCPCELAMRAHRVNP